MLWPSQSEVARRREQGVVVFLLLTVRRRKFKQCGHMRNQWQCQNQTARFFFFPDCRKPLRSAELFVLSCRYKPTLTPAQTSCLWRAQGQIVLRSLGSTRETGQGQGSKSPQIQQCCGSAMLQMAWGCVQSDSAPANCWEPASGRCGLGFPPWLHGKHESQNKHPRCWPSAEVRFILNGERKPFTVSRLS